MGNYEVACMLKKYAHGHAQKKNNNINLANLGIILDFLSYFGMNNLKTRHKNKEIHRYL